MKISPWLIAAATTSLLFVGVTIAQEPVPPLTSSAQIRSAASYPTPQGELTVRSTVAPPPAIMPAPSFSQLAHDGPSITEEQALGYLPLANDFLHADSNRNGTISKTEYENWVKQL